VNLAGRFFGTTQCCLRRAVKEPYGPCAARTKSTRRTLFFHFRVHAPAAKRCVMQILYSRCCGIDVHKDSVTACVLVYRDGTEPEVRKKEFGAYFKALLNMKMCFWPKKSPHVAMDSTGALRPSRGGQSVCWKPIWRPWKADRQVAGSRPDQSQFRAAASNA
jgi:hypothetical protein